MLCAQASAAMEKLVVEYAKSGRATCKHCNTVIAKGSVRLGSVTKDRGHDNTKWYKEHANPFLYSKRKKRLFCVDFRNLSMHLISMQTHLCSNICWSWVFQTGTILFALWRIVQSPWMLQNWQDSLTWKWVDSSHYQSFVVVSFQIVVWILCKSQQKNH